MVYASDQQILEKLDKLLWTFQPTSFLPHCFMHDETALLSSTPIVLSDNVAPETDYAILLNLHEQCPPDFARFKRVIEIAGQLPEDKASARKRYRHYQQAGFMLHHHQLQKH